MPQLAKPINSKLKLSSFQKENMEFVKNFRKNEGKAKKSTTQLRT